VLVMACLDPAGDRTSAADQLPRLPSRWAINPRPEPPQPSPPGRPRSHRQVGLNPTGQMTLQAVEARWRSLVVTCWVEASYSLGFGGERTFGSMC